MAELAARIIGRKCSLPVVVLIHLEVGREEAFPLRIRRLLSERSVVHPFETEILFCLVCCVERR